MKSLILILLTLSIYPYAIAQDKLPNMLPIAEHPNIGYKTSMVPDKETMIFEANPTIYPNLYNNIQETILNGDTNGYALYIAFKPQFRMYNDISKPVKMPSYKAALGGQWLRRLTDANNVTEQSFIAVSFETGHYSNGQSGSTFSELYQDGSPENDSIYATITPATDLSEMLNRTNGNFSTNYSEIGFNYRKYWIPENSEDYIPEKGISLIAKYTLYHDPLGLTLFLTNIGGYTAHDIKIYGRHRFELGFNYYRKYEKTLPIFKFKTSRYAFDIRTFLIATPHQSVQPFRAELTGSLYFKNDVGCFISLIAGHDNYNIRMVDNGFQMFAGLTFDLFPISQIRR